MEQNDKLVLVYTTFPSEAAATDVGESVVRSRLAACVNILPGMTSLYEWDGQLQRDQEAVMIVKTTRSRADEVIAAIKQRHTYDTPAILVLPVDGGSEAYLEWIRQAVSADVRSHPAERMLKQGLHVAPTRSRRIFRARLGT